MRRRRELFTDYFKSIIFIPTACFDQPRLCLAMFWMFLETTWMSRSFAGYVQYRDIYPTTTTVLYTSSIVLIDGSCFNVVVTYLFELKPNQNINSCAETWLTLLSRFIPDDKAVLRCFRYLNLVTSIYHIKEHLFLMNYQTLYLSVIKRLILFPCCQTTRSKC